jgi:hypothetical protein
MTTKDILSKVLPSKEEMAEALAILGRLGIDVSVKNARSGVQDGPLPLIEKLVHKHLNHPDVVDFRKAYDIAMECAAVLKPDPAPWAIDLVLEVLRSGAGMCKDKRDEPLIVECARGIESSPIGDLVQLAQDAASILEPDGGIEYGQRKDLASKLRAVLKALEAR